MTSDITQGELELLKIVRRLRPYGKVEIAMNQSGTDVSIILINSDKTVLTVDELLHK